MQNMNRSDNKNVVKKYLRKMNFTLKAGLGPTRREDIKRDVVEGR